MWIETLLRWLPWLILIIVIVALYGNRRRLSIFVELWDFMRVRKRWWLLPIIVALILISLFIVLVETLGPFMYAIF